MNRTHTATPGTYGTWHLWEVSNSGLSVTLSALHTRGAGLGDLVETVPTIASRCTSTKSGFWVFDVIASHAAGSAGWAPCVLHGACDVDAFVSRIADPLWARLTAVGFTDGAVYAELEQLLAAELEDAA